MINGARRSRIDGNSTEIEASKVEKKRKTSDVSWTQVSLTVFWGRWGLPLPKPVKLVFVRGRPLELPRIANPTAADVDAYHALYAARLLALYDAYRAKHPAYAHKPLHVE